MKVYFVGAGPGDPELITLKGRRLIEEAGVIIYAGSLVNPDLLKNAAPDAEILDSAGMNLDQVTAVYRDKAEGEGVLVRLHTGDPSLYGAIQEQIDFCRQHDIPCEVVPGVSSFAASAAALGQELTLPGVSQSLIITRRAGRTPVPAGESLPEMARHGATMALFLSVQNIEALVEDLKQGAYTDETPAAVVYRASWEDQKIVRANLGTLAEKVRAAGIKKQAMILVGDVMGGEYELSKLYDRQFSHGYRRGDDSSQLPPRNDPFGTPGENQN
ncbi:MAG: precorrin-4 C(11)-methyltransferase [Spirochaetales bacterium]|nr:precorrin-4 C(11)-methyltransferase [Spirochaetales bacterium]